MKNQFCTSLFNYNRFQTREILIGDLRIGGNNPIRVQSMTNTKTIDTESTVEQIRNLYEVGCELVRLTTPTVRDAQNLSNIKKELLTKGIKIPLVADVHFVREAAETAARIIEKVRINPGNYSEKINNAQIEFTDGEYNEELEKTALNLLPLINICKEYGTAVRIGVNHGSLSQRIMSRYGDTPLGMVESALEFLRMFEAENYKNLIISMKSSNVRVMVQSYRLLVSRMIEEGMNYPLHLGVTEAGDGYEGRIKSAIGIGSLLEDGIGDTIRVSLTETPENEIPVAVKMVAKYHHKINTNSSSPNEDLFNPFEYRKRKINIPSGFELKLPLVGIQINSADLTEDTLKKLYFRKVRDQYKHSDNSPDLFILYSDAGSVFYSSEDICRFIDGENLNSLKEWNKFFCVINMDNDFYNIPVNSAQIIILKADSQNTIYNVRSFISYLQSQGLENPIVLQYVSEESDKEQFVIQTSVNISSLLVDGLIDGLIITAKNIETELINETVFNMLQAARIRITRTEYISCPSCGRTLFDLVSVTAKIRSKTAHLKGVKIGIMGCIVNGPGEMADADYGYVGSGKNKVTLYKGKEVVERNIDEDDAVIKLIDLIKKDGKWVDDNLNI